MFQKPAQLFLLAILSCLSWSSYAQSNFIKGYFVTSQNDTISCLINDKNWARNPKEIQYRITSSGDTDTFKPSQIRSFSLSTGDVYEGRIVAIDGSSKDIEKLQLGSSFSGTVTDTVFLRVLVRGKANLLYLNTGKREHFYSQTDSGNTVELGQTYTLQEDPLTGKRLLITDNKYREQLKSYFKDCPDITERVAAVGYKKEDLKAIFKKYNTCRKSESYVSTEEEVKVSFGILAGPSHHQFSFEAADREDLNNTKFKSQIKPTVGLAMHVLLPRNRQRWSIYNEVFWKSFSTKGQHKQTIVYAYEYRTYDTEFSFNSVGLSNMVRYHFLFAPAQTFIGLGVSNSLLLNAREHQSIKVTYDFGKEDESYERIPVGLDRNYELALLLGAGVVIKNITAEMRAEWGNGLANGIMISSSRRSVSLLLGYYFN